MNTDVLLAPVTEGSYTLISSSGTWLNQINEDGLETILRKDYIEKMVESNKILQLVLMSTLVLTFMYEDFDEIAYARPTDNCNIREKSTLEASAFKRRRLRLLSRRLFTVIVTVHFVLLFKYLLLACLHLERFEEYRYLDCYILGRFSFSSKTYLATTVLTMIAIVYTLSYRFYTYNQASKLFNFELFRFLTLDHEEVLWNEIQLKKNRLGDNRRRTTNADGRVKKSSKKYLERYSVIEGEEAIELKELGNKYGRIKIFFENPFKIRTNKYNPMLLRLNRTADAWCNLKYSTTIYYPIGLTLLLMMGFSYVYMFIVKTVLTTSGYYVNYSLCVSYIKSLGPSSARNYSYIIDVNDLSLPNQSIPSLPVVSMYHIVRLLMDITDNLFIWVDSIMAATLHTSLMLMQVIDLGVYVYELERRLKRTLHIMRYGDTDKVYKSMKLEAVKIRSALEPLKTSNDVSLADHDEYCVPTTQAYVLDYLRLVKSYGLYSIYQTSAIAAVWLFMTAGISFWLGANRNLDLQGEFRWGQFGLAFFAVFCLSLSAYLESRTRKLYHLICIAMAIDTDVLVTKERWCNLTRFFYPKPMYCFAYFERSKISWLFCMKVSTCYERSEKSR